MRPLNSSFSLLVDGRAFSLQTKGGISQIWAKILSEPTILENIELHLFLYPGHTENIHLQDSGLLTNSRVKRTVSSIPPTDNFRFNSPEFLETRRSQVLKDRCNVLPSAVLNTYYGENILPDCKRYVVVVHDCAHEDHPQLRKKMSTESVIRRKSSAMRTASDIVCISGFTYSRVKALYPEISKDKCSVVYHGHDHLNYTVERVIGKFIHIGNRDGYKNFNLVYNAVRAILPSFRQMQFAIVGGEAADSRIEQLIFEFPKQVSFRTNVSDEYIMAELASSEGFISASGYEGFGIPLLAAMYAGTRPILSDIPVYRELASHHGIFFPLGDEGSLQRTLIRCFNSPKLNPTSAYRPWARVSQEYLDLLVYGGENV